MNDIPHLARYSSPATFTAMLTMIEVSGEARAVIADDDITSLQTLVSVYRDDAEALQSYLKNINKVYANRVPPIRLSPLVISRIMGVLYYYTVSTSLLHYLPDPMQVTVDISEAAGGWYRRYKYSKSVSEEIDYENDVPKLEGHKNWITFRDKFQNKLMNTQADKYLPLAYVLDESIRVPTRTSSPWILVPTVDLSDLTVFKSYAVHFGPQFKRDNCTV